MLRRTLLSLPLTATLLAGCGARDRSQGEVFAAYLRTLAGLQPFPQGLAHRDLPQEAFEPASRDVHLVVESRVASGWRRWGWKDVGELRKTLPGVQPAAAADLLSRHGSTATVHIPPHLLPPKVSVDCVDPAVLKALFKSYGEAGWAKFFEKFPRSRAISAFSPVGFGIDGTQAVFYFDMACGSLCGSGYGVLMRRSAAGWQVADHRQLWAS